MSLTRKRLIEIAEEANYGKAETTGFTQILVGNPNITPLSGENVQRNIIRPYFGNAENIMVTQQASVDFEMELTGAGIVGSGVTATVNLPPLHYLLKACGFSANTAAGQIVYTLSTPSSLTSGASLTIKFHNDGTEHILFGARGNVSFDLTVKKIPTMKFTFTGLLGTISSQPIPSANYQDITPVPVSSDNTKLTSFFGLSTIPLMESLTVDLANEVKLRTLVGGQHVVISDRKPKGNIKFEAPSVDGTGGHNFFEDALKTNKGSLSITHGTTAGYKIKIESANSGVTLDAPKYASNEGYDMLDVGLVFLPTNAGNDELKITIL
jgi:hypothetical protein